MNVGGYDELGMLQQQLGAAGQAQESEVSSFSAQNPHFSSGDSGCCSTAFARVATASASTPSLSFSILVSVSCFHPLPIRPSLCSAPESFCSSCFCSVQC